ncbi:MAG: flagellar hook protein FlgE [Lachnospiraceae bacterium]|nr:flagellar hook protein FlgE [Lachnospiraceae bacterium]
MMRSLYSGVAGLKTHQTKMDVIGNNIANVNTVGFKSSQVLFKDVLYQTTQSATGSTNGSGGTNAQQVGLGTGVATVSVTQTSGSAQTTNNPYDLMINGSSFFVVNRGGINYFTKVGAFTTDDAGNLVTGSGDYVMGWQVNPENPNEIKRDTVSALRPEAEENQTAAPELTSQTYMTGNIDATDPRLQTEEGVVTTVSIYDSLGYSYTVKFKITANGEDGKYDVKVDSIRDENNVDISDKYNIAFPGGTDVRSNTISFNPDTGAFVGVGGPIGNETLLLEITPKTDPISGEPYGDVFRDLAAVNQDDQIPGITVDFSNLTMFSDSGECDVETHRGRDVDPSDGAGRTVGSLTDVTIDTQGRLYGVYDNGVSKLLGQIAVANFINPAGLEAIGGSLYKETRASGEFDGIGKDIASTGETMTQGVLEMSNVDLSQEFTDMIVTQRGFQANSRIITVSDTLIEELVNLKR